MHWLAAAAELRLAQQETPSTNDIYAIVSREIHAGASQSCTALLTAAKAGNVAVVNLLLARGADTEAEDNVSWLPNAPKLCRERWARHGVVQLIVGVRPRCAGLPVLTRTGPRARRDRASSRGP